MNDINHITTTDSQKLWDALCGDDYELRTDLTPRQEAEALNEGAAGAGITQSDESFEALVEAVEGWREEQQA